MSYTKTRREIVINRLAEEIADCIIDTWEAFPNLTPDEIRRALTMVWKPLSESEVGEEKILH
jgi:hypothetical protein